MSKSAVRSRVQVFFDDDTGLTHQEFKESCDIRSIMKQFKRQGIGLPIPNFNDAILDYSDLPDYQSALNLMIDAQNSFDSLPANVRKRFGNDPGEFVNFIYDPANEQELIKMGLATAKPDANLSTKTEAKAEADPSST